MNRQHIPISPVLLLALTGWGKPPVAIVVEATVNERGEVVGVRVVKGVRPDLDEAAQRAVRSTAKDGRPTQATIAIPVSFRLKERPRKA